MEDKLTELLVACGITWYPRALAQALIEAGVTIDPNSKHCYQCEHFIGSGDWNLCCGIKGDLCYKNTVACDDFKEKEKND